MHERGGPGPNVLRGLEAGTDSDITKRREPEEIVGCMHRVLSRRSGGVSASRVAFLGHEFELRAGREQFKLDILVSAFEEVIHLNRELEQERARANELLHVILPSKIVSELKATKGVKPRQYTDVAVLFADIVGFTSYCDKNPLEKVVDSLQRLIEAWEEIALRHGVEKIKTIGDAYVAAGGLLQPLHNPVLSCIRCGLEMIAATHTLPAGWNIPVRHPLRERHGRPDQPAGQYLFDLWGDTVNAASRIESNGLAGQITLSTEAWREVQRPASAGASRWDTSRSRGRASSRSSASSGSWTNRREQRERGDAPRADHRGQPDAGAAVRDLLEEAGFEVETAPDAEQAWAGRGGPFDLVLSDLHLPGDSGFDLCRRLKADPAEEHAGRRLHQRGRPGQRAPGASGGRRRLHHQAPRPGGDRRLRPPGPGAAADVRTRRRHLVVAFLGQRVQTSGGSRAAARHPPSRPSRTSSTSTSGTRPARSPSARSTGSSRSGTRNSNAWPTRNAKAHDELKRAESQLVQSETLSAMGKMVAGVAHEINNPLAFVTNNLAVLQREVGHLQECPALPGSRRGPWPSIAPSCRAIPELADEIDLTYVLDHLGGILDVRSTG